MQIQNNYYIDTMKILDDLSQDVNHTNTEKLENQLSSCLLNIVKNHFSDRLSTEFITNLSSIVESAYFKYFFRRTNEVWQVFLKINAYINCQDPNKASLLEEINREMKEKDRASMMDPVFTKSIYLSNIPEIIAIHRDLFPVPPASLFGVENTPKTSLEKQREQNHILTQFKHQNGNDPLLVNKIKFIQRHIRAKIRHESEIQRITKRHFDKLPLEKAHQKSSEVINDANTPYHPQKCSPELAVRIMNAAGQVNLYSSVFHLTATKNSAKIMDGCVFGRENLVNSYTHFRPAALMNCDIVEGDGNVICFGPNMIDPLCLKDRTLRLEFDINKLLETTQYNKNPNIFFKQRDFGYNIGMMQTVEFKDEILNFQHTQPLTNSKLGHTNIQLFDTSGYRPKYYSECPKYSFISYNMNEMQKILSLNFFRFLDCLIDANDGSPATSEINRIYGWISKMTDSELVEFLTDLGRKMSCSSEFNFYGAYELDLNALLSISFYNDENIQDTVTLKQLIEELNTGCFDSFQKISKLAPELLKSTRFVEWILSKIATPSRVSQVNEFVRFFREQKV